MALKKKKKKLVPTQNNKRKSSFFRCLLSLCFAVCKINGHRQKNYSVQENLCAQLETGSSGRA